MVAALRHDRVTAPMTLNGAMTGDSFRSKIAQVLGPTLRRGDIVVIDNVPLHPTLAVRDPCGRIGVDARQLTF
jgi:transposase